MEIRNAWVDVCVGLQLLRTGIVKISFGEFDPTKANDQDTGKSSLAGINTLTMHVVTFAQLVHSIEKACKDPAIRQLVDHLNEVDKSSESPADKTDEPETVGVFPEVKV
jgi:hypothetical protein